MKKISVIIPVYNVENYLEECLDSIVNQTMDLDDIEVIMINDCSSDNSLKICKKYEKKYNFVLIDNKKNMGLAATRNRGINKANGKYIIFLDSDDYYKEDSFDLLYSKIESDKSDIVISKLNSFNSSGEYGYYSDKYLNCEFSGSIYDKPNLLNCISCCAKIYKTNFVRKILFLEGTYHEDNSFTLISYFKAKKLSVLPVYTYYRRIRENGDLSIMQSLDYNKFLGLMTNFKEVIKRLDNNKISILNRFIVKKMSNYIVKNLEIKDRSKAKNDAISFIKNSFDKKYLIHFKLYYVLSSIYIKIRKNI